MHHGKRSEASGHGKRSEASGHGKRSEASSQAMLEIVPNQSATSDAAEPVWEPPILRTVALDGTGIPKLVDAIADHRAYLDATGGWTQRERWRLQSELDLLLQNTLVEDFHSRLPAGVYEQAVEDMLKRHISPFQAVEKLVDSVG